MAKHKAENKPKNNNALPKADIEFAEERGNGLEKKALRALKSPKQVNKQGQLYPAVPKF